MAGAPQQHAEAAAAGPARPPRRRILLTGAAGAIGRCITPALREAGHDVRGFDAAACPDLDDHHIGKLIDAGAIDRAMADRDTLMHLAAYPNDADFLDDLLEPNIIGLHRVLDAAVRHGVRRVVLASSGQVCSSAVAKLPRPAPGRPPIDLPNRAASPRNAYAVTKLFAEHYGQMVAARHVVSVLAVRIGWFVRGPREAALIRQYQAQAAYLSRDDTRRLFTAAAAADLSQGPDRFAVVYGYGPRPTPDTPHVDLETGRRLLGFEPRDRFPAGLPDAWLDADPADPGA
jgi:uronate dehydrogenase